MKVYTVKELRNMDSIPVYYGDELRQKKKAIGLNGMVISGVRKIKIMDELIIFKNERYEEIIRQSLSEINELKIDINFGEYKFI